MDDDGQCVMAISGIMFGVYLIFNLAWIIPDLIFANQDLLCVTTMIDGFTINLSTWLKVDGYVRVAATSILLFITIIVWVKSQDDQCDWCCCIVGWMFLFLVFTSIWGIVGSVMFWGHANPTGICTGAVQAYLYALLIVQDIITAIICLFIMKQILGRRKGSGIEQGLLN